MTTAALDQYVTFIAGEETYAVPVSHIREIVRVSKITKLPMAPEHVEGVMNLRGEVLPIINLRKLLNLPVQDISSSKIVILTQENKNIGVIVDRTSQVIRASEEDHQEPSTKSRFVSKVIRTRENLCLLLNIDELFGSQETSSETRRIEAKTASREEATTTSNYVQIVTFELAGGTYAFKIEGVQEIIRYVEPTQMPGVPHYIKGLIELRKTVLSLVDLRALLGFSPVEADEFTKVIVLRIQSTLVGVIVDRIRGVMRIEESRVLPPPLVTANSHAEELIGVVHDGKDMIMVLDHSAFLTQQISSLGGTEKTEEAGEKTSVEEEKQYVIFSVGGEEYGVQIEEIREINRLTTLAKIPKAPDYLEGLMNLRGDVIPVIDLRKKFKLPSIEKDNMMVRVIVNETEGKKIAFIVDSVVGVQRIPLRLISPIPETISFGESGRFAPKVARVDDRIILLLDMSRILTEQEMRTVEKTTEKVNEEQPRKLKRAK